MAALTAQSQGEQSGIRRLTSGIKPEAQRQVLEACLAGSVSPAVALMQLLTETENVAQVRSVVDEITRRAATLSRATDSLLRDRVDELTQLVVENEPGCEKIAEMLRANVDSPDEAPTPEEGIAFCERLFDWSVQQSEEASVALYSLGNPQLLERATREVIAQLELWNILSQKRVVLDIGCGIGRIAEELAPRVKEVHGTDISGGMIDAARKRCAPHGNVWLVKGNGHDLREYADSMFDAAVAVDTFPYVRQSGAALVAGYFREASRVLKPGGELVIFNYSYRGDDNADVEEILRFASEHGFDIIVRAEKPLAMWDALTFVLRKRVPG